MRCLYIRLRGCTRAKFSGRLRRHSLCFLFLAYYQYGTHCNFNTDHQPLISAPNASERSKTSQSRLARWYDRLISPNFGIKHLAGNEMGLIDYLSRKTVKLARLPSAYDKEFAIASTTLFINNLEVVENVILINLANQKGTRTRHDICRSKSARKNC